MTRQGHTGREMEASGEWVKVGSKHYQHVSGAEIKYDHNAWGWRVNGGKQVWKTLFDAKWEFENRK